MFPYTILASMLCNEKIQNCNKSSILRPQITDGSRLICFTTQYYPLRHLSRLICPESAGICSLLGMLMKVKCAS